MSIPKKTGYSPRYCMPIKRKSMQNLQKIKFLQIGLGSMGKLRIRNLLHHGVSPSQITGFDIRDDRRREAEKLLGISTIKKFQGNADIFIISSPPNTHAQYFLFAAN